MPVTVHLIEPDLSILGQYLHLEFLQTFLSLVFPRDCKELVLSVKIAGRGTGSNLLVEWVATFEKLGDQLLCRLSSRGSQVLAPQEGCGIVPFIGGTNHGLFFDLAVGFHKQISQIAGSPIGC